MGSPGMGEVWRRWHQGSWQMSEERGVKSGIPEPSLAWRWEMRSQGQPMPSE